MDALCSQLLAAFTILLFTHPRLRQKKDISFHTFTASPVQNSAHDTDISVSACLSDAVKTAALNLVGVCGFVVFFSVFLSSLYTLFQPLFTMTPKLFVLCCGFFELTRGVTIAAELSTPPLTALFCAAFCGWAGLCVHMQVMSFQHQYIFLRTLFTAKNDKRSTDRVLLFIVCHGAARILSTSRCVFQNFRFSHHSVYSRCAHRYLFAPFPA